MAESSRKLISLAVNGEPIVMSDDDSLADLLRARGLPARGIAVERNREIVPRALHGVTRLADGDRVEIVQFVGGG